MPGEVDGGDGLIHDVVCRDGRAYPTTFQNRHDADGFACYLNVWGCPECGHPGDQTERRAPHVGRTRNLYKEAWEHMYNEHSNTCGAKMSRIAADIGLPRGHAATS